MANTPTSETTAKIGDIEMMVAGSDVSVHESSAEPYIDTAKEKALMRKLDLHLIPIIMALYLFSFLDKVNIGNARLYGLEADLGLVGNQYQIAVSILFVTYCLFEVPSNLIIKKVKPDRFIAFITTGWGIVATLTGLVQGYGGLLVVRLLMGVLEAGLFPGLVVYLTMFYGRYHLAVRVGYLFIASAIAGALGGIIAYGIGFMDGVAGLKSWRWLMIIEGIPSVIIGVLVLVVLPTNPSVARFLTTEEKDLLIAIRKREVGQTASAQDFHWADVKEGVLDWQVWLMSFSGFTNDIMFYGFSTFLPTIIKSIGKWTAPQAQALTVPVFAFGTCTYLIVAHISDRQQRRGVYASAFAVISVIGYCMLIANKGPAVSYAGCFVIAFGLYVAVGLPLAWLPGNKPRYGKRAVATGMQYTIGNTAGIATPFLFKTADSPKFYAGYGVSIAAVSVSACIFAFMTLYYTKINKNRAEGKEDFKMEGKTKEEIDNMGDRSPKYVYSV